MPSTRLTNSTSGSSPAPTPSRKRTRTQGKTPIGDKMPNGNKTSNADEMPATAPETTAIETTTPKATATNTTTIEATATNTTAIETTTPKATSTNTTAIETTTPKATDTNTTTIEATATNTTAIETTTPKATDTNTTTIEATATNTTAIETTTPKATDTNTTTIEATATNTTAIETTTPETTTPTKIISMSEDGKMCFLSVEEVTSILDKADDPTETITDIFQEAARYQDGVEDFQVWVSRLWDLVVDRELWRGKYATFKQWVSESYNEICGSIAREGHKIRDRKAEAIRSLASLGASGPRFQHLVKSESRNFLNTLRNQMARHNLSYPLAVVLSNVQTYHRIAPGSAGRRGIQRTPSTQPIDIEGLESVVYRKLSDEEMAAAQVVVGPHGFLVSRLSTPTPVEDEEFDRAVESFEPGKRAAEQSSPCAKADLSKVGNDGDAASDAREKPVFVRPETFSFVTECSCEAAVPSELRASLDEMHWSAGYDVLEPLWDTVAEVKAGMCVRHCQVWLVYGLGVGRLKRKSDHDYLVEEITSRMYRLSVRVDKKPGAKEDFSDMKKGLVFSWDDLSSIKVPNLKRKALGQLAGKSAKR
ncbi:hypothetical protein EV127DRAFT_409701 [Xylaria flabelliformis]|nr:hypothetical protein EV127DRAFT_409701 [Xylaria flabelliformis]